MDRLECSVWNNGKNGWGLKVLGGPDIRRANFAQDRRTITLVLDGNDVPLNIAKASFWNRTCGELIKKELGAYIEHHGLATGDRVWLCAVEPGVKFVVERT